MSTNDKAVNQASLPFPPTPSASIAGRTMQESVYKRRVEPRRLPADAPNILIVLIDDAGPGLPRIRGQSGLTAGLLQKGETVPSVFDRHLRQQQATVSSK